jgi:hypothetical protein
MNDAADFWLNVSRLADSREDCGATQSERATTALQLFEQMPPVAKREVLCALKRLAYELPDLYMIAVGREGSTASGNESKG